MYKYLLLVLLCITNASIASEHILIATEEYPPYCSQNLKEQGIDCHIVRQAFQRVHVDVTFKFYPGARSYDLAETGKIIATLPWAKRKDRDRSFLYSDAVITVQPEHYFYLKKNKQDWSGDLSDFQFIKKKRIGAIIGHNYGEKFQEAEKNKTISVTRVSKPQQAFQMLVLNRIDAVICKQDVGEYELNHCIKAAERALIESTSAQLNQTSQDYMLFSRKHPHGERLQTLFNTGLKSIREDGTYEKILTEFKSGLFNKQNTN